MGEVKPLSRSRGGVPISVCSRPIQMMGAGGDRRCGCKAVFLFQVDVGRPKSLILGLAADRTAAAAAAAAAAGLSPNTRHCLLIFYYTTTWFG